MRNFSLASFVLSDLAEKDWMMEGSLSLLKSAAIFYAPEYVALIAAFESVLDYVASAAKIIGQNARLAETFQGLLATTLSIIKTLHGNKHGARRWKRVKCCRFLVTHLQ